MENILKARMMQAGNPSLVEGLSRFFKTGKGQYGEGDRFLGIKVPVTRAIVKECWKKVSSCDLEECITSEYHEIRLAALLCLVRIFKGSRKDPSRQKECIDFYLSHTAHINNWDLVDLSCYELLGAWLVDKDRSLLFDLARDGKTIWEQRIGIVSTLAFIRRGELEECFEISDIMLAAKGRMHDLLQKATGWMLREAGKRDQARLVEYLRQRWNVIPATMRRYACEKLSVETVESLRQESITIRKSKPEDLPRLMEIFAHARSFMVSTGNPDQWAEDYPGRELLLKEKKKSQKQKVKWFLQAILTNGRRIILAGNIIRRTSAVPTAMSCRPGALSSPHLFSGPVMTPLTVSSTTGNGLMTVHMPRYTASRAMAAGKAYCILS